MIFILFYFIHFFSGFCATGTDKINKTDFFIYLFLELPDVCKYTEFWNNIYYNLYIVQLQLKQIRVNVNFALQFAFVRFNEYETKSIAIN